MNDWNIKSRSETCAQSGRPFTEGEIFYSAIYLKDAQYERIDLSREAWETRNENLQLLSFWQSTFELPPPPAPEPLKKDDAESLLRRLVAENDPAQRNTRYILALMLERKREIRPVDRKDDGGASMIVYEHPASGEIWLIEDPGLRLDQLDSVQTEVSALLSRSFSVVPAEAAAPVEAIVAAP